MIITEKDLLEAVGKVKDILKTNLPLTDDTTIEMVAKVVVAEYIKPMAEEYLRAIKGQSTNFREHTFRHEKLVQKHAKLDKTYHEQTAELRQKERTINRLMVQNSNLTNALTKLVLRSEE